MKNSPEFKSNAEKLKKEAPKAGQEIAIEKEPKIIILDMKEFIREPKEKVMKAVVEKYGGQYHIPGLEYEKYLLENPDKIPKELKDGKKYYLMGDDVRDDLGELYILCVVWSGGKLYNDANWRAHEWRDTDRVLLLEK